MAFEVRHRGTERLFPGCLFNLEHSTQMLHVWNIYTYIYPKNDPNVGKYSIHGASGLYKPNFVAPLWPTCLVLSGLVLSLLFTGGLVPMLWITYLLPEGSPHCRARATSEVQPKRGCDCCPDRRNTRCSADPLQCSPQSQRKIPSPARS